MRIRLFGQYMPMSMVVLATFETSLFFGLLFGAGVARFGENLAEIERTDGPLWPRGIVFSISMVASLLAFGLYSARQRARTVGICVRVLAAVSAGIVVTAVWFYVVPNLGIGRGVLSLAASSAAAAVVALRLGFGHFFDDGPLKRRVLVYGNGHSAAAIARLRRRSDQRGFVVTGFVRPEGECAQVPKERVIRSDGELLECRLAGVEVTEVATFLERETGRVRIDVLNPSWLIFSEGFRCGSLRHFTAGSVGVVASLAVLLLTLPLMLATAIAIKLEDGWRAPVFYAQERVGLGGRVFKVLKFRSMRVNAEANGVAQWAQKRDPRVTRVGAIVRRLRIDELPQILNVLRGDMCFVGPRPERPKFVAELAERIPYYMQRHCVKPGITGWAQLCYPYGSSEKDALEKLQYDLYYIKNNCLLFDLSILVQTAEVVFMGKGGR
jgi:lipopolysaccharide/colanic/teichoic acid biosynthesis glycosyltransferase